MILLNLIKALKMLSLAFTLIIFIAPLLLLIVIYIISLYLYLYKTQGRMSLTADVVYM